MSEPIKNETKHNEIKHNEIKVSNFDIVVCEKGNILMCCEIGGFLNAISKACLDKIINKDPVNVGFLVKNNDISVIVNQEIKFCIKNTPNNYVSAFLKKKYFILSIIDDKSIEHGYSNPKLDDLLFECHYLDQ